MKGPSFASEDRPAYRTVVFDLYGTLADIRTDEEDPAVWEAFSRKMTDFGAVREAAAWKEEYARTCRLQERAMEEELQRAGIPGPPEIDLLSVWREMAAGCGVRLTTDAVQSVSECFRKASMRRLRLYDGAAEVLAALRSRGIRLVLLTNAQESFTRQELKTLGIDGAFDELFLSSACGVRKPSPAFFAKVWEAGGDPRKTLMVGNDDECDCRGAAAVGMDSLWLCTEQSPKRVKSLPEGCRQVKDLREILGAF